MKRILSTLCPLLLISTLSLHVAAATRLDVAREHYAKQPNRSFSATISPRLPENSPMAGFPIPSIRYRVASIGERGIAMRADTGAMEPSFVQNEGEQITFLPFARAFVRESRSDSIEQLLAESQELAVPGGDLLIGLAFGAMSDLFAADARRLDDETIDGIDCAHFELSGARSGEVWIANGESPWVVRFLESPTEATEPVPGEDGGSFSFQPQLDLRFSDWGDESQSAALFDLNPGIGFDRVASIEEAMQRLQGGAPPEIAKEDHPGVDQPAPAVTIRPMGGEPFSLASRKGKVVVLDFWASWCKPCIIDMPLLVEALEGFSEDQVELWAVNRFESVETINRFLSDEKIEIPTALDPDNAVASAFQVTGIPHVVIVDQQGVVRFVHVGTSFDNKDYVRGEVESLLGSAK